MTLTPAPVRDAPVEPCNCHPIFCRLRIALLLLPLAISLFIRAHQLTGAAVLDVRVPELSLPRAI